MAKQSTACLQRGSFSGSYSKMSYDQFNKIYLIIKDNKVFDSKFKGQFPVSVQLSIVLHRLGTYGNGATVKNISKLFGQSDGSSITRMTRRVIKAVLDVEHEYIFWPDEKERRDFIVPSTILYLPQCIGFVDGVKIELDEPPRLDKEAYFDPKSNYSLNVR